MLGKIYRRRWLILFAVMLFVFGGCLAEKEVSTRQIGGRRIINLDGSWEIAQGSMDSMPDSFQHRVPVPGLVDMSSPAFDEVGKKSDKREAFWYRRTFTVEGKIPDVALLKIHKAKYGTKVFLNGEMVGEHLPCFTPAILDVKEVLKNSGEDNELIVRVGANREDLPKDMPSGWDFEKYLYIPGIYDSVELILTGAPYISNIQVVPQIEDSSVRINAYIHNPTLKDHVQVACKVRGFKSGKVGSSEVKRIKNIGEDEAFTVDMTIPMKGCKLWTPEEPVLYEVKVDIGTDALMSRFGMRSFKFDKESGRAVLNGKPYVMRGTNVCAYRFFEDEKRGDKPWRREWVRRLHRKFKSMNWNSIRYCIGFPPELWYEIADEEGFLIQDEFPIWLLSKAPENPKSENIIPEYMEWMHERWNHPCVVIWDAQNESVTEETGKALNAVRHLDLSHRPWDNGWALPQSDVDCLESHPYFFSKLWKDYWADDKKFELSYMVNISGKPRVRKEQESYGLPIILNEYAWLWLNRDGSTTCLTENVYKTLIGPDSTVAQRRLLYARYLAALSEFWRCHRECAGVLHFCGLGYSRAGDKPRPEGGATSDHFIDLERLIFEPNFERYVRDAFSPVGLMLDFWDAEVESSDKGELKVFVINDLYEKWEGTVCLRIMRGNKTISKQTKDCTVDTLGREILTFEQEFPKREGEYNIIGELLKVDGAVVRSLRDFKIVSTDN